MLFADCSPPSFPSLEQQRDALRKGLGQAMRWATARRLDDGPLLAACLEDQRYDAELEGTRGDWLWRMIRAIDAADRFRGPILRALCDLTDERTANQLCELAQFYAAAGDEAFRIRLYEIVERKPFPEREWLGEDEIIQLDGEPAFLFAARVRGERLMGRAWDWDDGVLVREADERFGEARTIALLESSADPAIRAFREAWQQENQAEGLQEFETSHQDRMRSIPVEEILSTAQTGGSPFGRFRGWGMYAEEADLATVFRHLSAAPEPSVVADLLRVFSNRPAPRFVVPLIEFCRHADPEVRRRALIALEQVEHPVVREFALSLIDKGVDEGGAIGLLRKNFLPGDERRILRAIEIPHDEQARHGLMMDVIEVLEDNPDADPSRLAIVAYASTPCENCRFIAARLLLERDMAPRWLLDECRGDSSERSRNLVADAPGEPEAEGRALR